MKGSGAPRRIVPTPIPIADENDNVSNIVANSVQEDENGIRSNGKPTFKEALLEIDERRGIHGPAGKRLADIVPFSIRE